MSPQTQTATISRADRKPVGRIDYSGNHFDSSVTVTPTAPGIILNAERIAVIGAQMKQSREASGLSQRELSKLSGQPQTYISELENGRHSEAVRKDAA